MEGQEALRDRVRNQRYGGVRDGPYPVNRANGELKYMPHALTPTTPAGWPASTAYHPRPSSAVHLMTPLLCCSVPQLA